MVNFHENSMSKFFIMFISSVTKTIIIRQFLNFYFEEYDFLSNCCLKYNCCGVNYRNV